MLLRGLTILLVEDDVDNLELIASYFEGEGAVVLGAGSIAGALALCQGRKLDFVVSDLELADGDGCALLTQLKRDHGDVPAIAITGYAEQNWRAKATAVGFLRFAVKPFSLSVLAQWIVELSPGRSVCDGAASALC